MPNVEVIGFAEERKGDIESIIFSTIEDILPKNIEDTVVTFIESQVVDQFRVPKPYLRILHTNRSDAMKLGKALSKQYGLDTEIATLEYFFPGKA